MTDRPQKLLRRHDFVVAGCERELRGACVEPCAALGGRIIDRVGTAHRVVEAQARGGEPSRFFVEPGGDDVERRIVAMRSHEPAGALDVAQLQIEARSFRRQSHVAGLAAAGIEDGGFRLAEAVQREQRARERDVTADVTTRQRRERKARDVLRTQHVAEVAAFAVALQVFRGQQPRNQHVAARPAGARLEKGNVRIAHAPVGLHRCGRERRNG